MKLAVHMRKDKHGILPCCGKTPGQVAAEAGTRTIFVTTVPSLVTCGKDQETDGEG